MQIVFRLGLVLFLLSVEIPLYLWVRNRLGSTKPERVSLRAIQVLFLLFGGGVALWTAIRPDIRTLPPWQVVLGIYPVLLWHGSLIIFGVGLLLWKSVAFFVRSGGKLLAMIPPVQSRTTRLRLHPDFRRFDASRRLFIRRGALGLAGATFAGTSYGMIVGRSEIDMTTTEIPITGLPPEYDGFVIGVVSDIHSGIYMFPSEMREYVARLNDIGADLIAVPGDFVNGQVEEVYPFAEAFSRLKAPHGVFGVLGNHDFYSGNPDLVAQVAGEAGIRMLRDESVTVTRGGADLLLAGVDDVGRNDRGSVKIEAALAGRGEGVASILLCHRPYHLPEAAAKNVGLVLSGHTHGGQIVFGRFGNAVLTPAAFASSYIWGRYESGTTQMYVTRGIGTVGLPVRINCPPEISRLILRRA